MDPKLRASIEVAASAFAVGALTYVAPIVQGGQIPAQWGPIVLNALVAGALAAYHRLQPSPKQAKKPVITLPEIRQ